MNIFEQASRLALRFDTPVGIIDVEDIWELPLAAERAFDLDDLARGLHAALKEETNVSFVNPTKKPNEALQLRFDLVKHIIDVRLAERDALATAEANRQKKQKLLALLEQKENEGLSALSADEIRAQIATL